MNNSHTSFYCKSVNKLNKPDGIYNGFWGGWEAWFESDETMKFSVDSGVRTPRMPVKIIVEKGIAYICSKES